MALHQVKLPRSATYLFRIVVLQKRLLKALADPALNPSEVNTVWVQGVWHNQGAEWVRKFCHGGQEGRIQAIARATPTARQALYSEFCRQNKVAVMLGDGGNFQGLESLPDFTTDLARNVKDFFKRCYKLLSEDQNRQWSGVAPIKPDTLLA